MTRRSMSDIIESYLKSFLKQNQQIEIKRSDIAEQFDCVPSQVNYVINTRFTQAHGYQVESKRGGGGYIRIVKINFVDEVDYLDQMIRLVGNKVNQRQATDMINTLVKRDIMTEREGRLLLELTSKDTIEPIGQREGELRAYLLKKAFNQLRIN